ncbi:hypothetical protein SAY87_027689 [Trapa incisa]|uniref:Secreted protein n=1 Tax=Trapa incisa TaxID=236973 RepID=A0AAN7JMV7_9MYRT|nr:hypothetical protein SAY87_027689 [Trapa incisa]
MPCNSAAVVSLVLLIFFLASSPTTNLNASITVSAARPVKGPEFARETTTLEPSSRATDGSRSVEGCLPKGLPHNSAPSRYVNYLPLGSSLCTPPRSDADHWP